MTPKFNFVVCAIEESKDIDKLSLDELQSSLLVHEQKFNQQDRDEQALKTLIDKHPSTANRGRGRGRGRGNMDRRHHQQHQQQDSQSHDSHGRERGRDEIHSITHRRR